VKAYVPLRVACLDIMLWPMGTWFPECWILCCCSFLAQLHSVAAGMLCLIVAALWFAGTIILLQALSVMMATPTPETSWGGCLQCTQMCLKHWQL
jgi:hypothetical protein